jgi:hypothetical protein
VRGTNETSVVSANCQQNGTRIAPATFDHADITTKHTRFPRFVAIVVPNSMRTSFSRAGGIMLFYGT